MAKDYEFKKSIVYSRNIEELDKLRGKKIQPIFSHKLHQIISNLEFGKTYYMYYKDKLIAFKIHAFSMLKEDYLIQTPTCFMWVNLKYYRVFNKKEEYFLYLEGKCNPIQYNFEYPFCFTYFKYVKNSNIFSEYYLKNSFKWDKGLGKPKAEMSYVYDLLYTESGFIYYYDIIADSFTTYEECVQNNMNGMEVVDFEEEITPTITITFKTETKPKIHTLRFIEE